MIVGSKVVNDAELSKHVGSVSDFKDYCKELVPVEFRHLQAVINNQIYLCCLYVRRSNRIDWETKKKILNDALRDVHIVGCTNELLNVSDILMYIER